MSRTNRFLIYLLSVFMAVMMAAAVEAAGGNCLICHGEKTIIDKGAHLYIDPVKYEATTHARIGCVSCHTKVTQRHPADGIRPSRAKCEECHAAVFAEYEQSTHSAYAGCTDCHKPHAVRPLLAVSGRDINIQCAKCHDNSVTVKSHSKWLPQAALHIDALPCITCHTGSKDYVIIMYLAKRVSDSLLGGVTLAGFEDLRPLLSAGKKVGRLIDTNGDGAVSLNELKAFNKSSQFQNMSLLGTMMPEVVTHNYQILNNRWDCTFCHASGPNAQQNSYLALPEQDGTYSRMIVEKGAILDILFGTPDFYMTGFTRSKTLSIIGAVIAAYGLLVPILHGTLRFLTRKKKGALIMAQSSAEEQVYFTPTPVRIWHWVNALGIITLIVTGLQIRFPEYANIFGTYKAAIKLHDIAGLTVSVSFCLWIFYYLVVAKSVIKVYVPTFDDIKSGLFQQAFFYFFAYFLGKENPHSSTPDNKFNAIQKITYFITMFLFLPLVIVSGLLLMNVAPLRGWIIMIGGIKFLVDAHYLIACSFFSFLCVHIYMATLGHTPFAHFRQMWTGWEKIESHHG